MNMLNVTPEQLDSKAAELDTRGTEVSSIVEEMISLIDSIGATQWSGEAATAYKNKFDELRDDAQRMKQDLSQAADSLKQIAAQYRQAEEQNQAVASSLAADIF